MKWQTASLRDVAPPEPAKRLPDREGTTWLLTLDQIESGTGIIVGKKIGPASEAGSSTFPFDSGNVLYSKLRPYLNKVVWPQESGVATTELVPLRPKGDVLHCGYLTYYLRSHRFLTFAQSCVAGVKMPRIIMDKFWEHRVPLPPLSEQRRIVEILDQADALIKKRAEADVKAERILPALFHKMFGDAVSNPKGWRVLKVAQAAEVQRGDFRHRPRTEQRFYGGQYPFIQINDVTSSRIIIREYTQTLNEEGLAISRLFPSGTVVLSIAATIAASGILGFESCFPDSLVGVKGRPDLTTQEFLLFYFRSIAPRLIAQAPQLAQKNINLQILNDLDIPLPPLELQRKFSLAVSEFVAISDRESSASVKLDTLWGTLLNRAFSGRITAKWREAHMNELLVEIEEQTKTLSEIC